MSNAAGAWANGSSDPMYNTYLYPLGPGNLTATVTNLPAGSYDFYFYSHDGNYTLSVDGTSYGTQTTRESPVVNPTVWQEGKQYTVFHSVAVAAGQTVQLTVAPGVDGYAVLSGLQIAPPTTVTGAPPSIIHQPQSQTAVNGASVNFTVTASGTAPLSYQWHFNGSDIAGATSTVLHLGAVQDTDAGTYSVTVSNIYGSVTSSDATLTVQAPGSFSLIDVNLGAHTNPGLNAQKTGFAAIGITTNDFWNFYSRDDGNGGFLANGSLANLKFVDGSISGAGLTMSNAAGAWANGSTDPMYNTYLYPLGPGNMTATITNLPAGNYDFYFYSHDGNYTLSVNGVGYGTETTRDYPVANPAVWQEGKQYAVFHGVSVSSGETVALTVAHGVDGYSVLSGFQIATATTVTGTPPSILTQPQSQSAGVGAGVTFTVTARGSAPLSYQWRHDGADIIGATASALTLSNLQTNDAGAYSVLVTNAYGSVLSSDATLTVQDGGSFALIDVNFGAHTNPGLNAQKTGFAATGVSSNDFWNFYSRDDGHGGFLVNGSLPNLKQIDGSITSAGLTVSNAAGAWANGSTDPMYNTYLYPLGPGYLTATVTNLPAGAYDIYVYSHDGNYMLTAGGTSYGPQTNRESPIVNPTVWQEGKQYTRFQGVSVDAGQAITLTAAQGVDGYAVVSGIQIAASGLGRPPSAGTVTAGTVQNKPVTVPMHSLMLATSDNDGHAVHLSAISTNSASGASVVTAAGNITYSPRTNFMGLDYFTYTVADSTGAKSVGFVLVNVRSAEAASGFILPLTPLTEGGFHVSFAGLPGRTYKLQRSSSPAGPWTNMAPITIDYSGVGVFKDTNPPKSAGFYRTVYP